MNDTKLLPAPTDAIETVFERDICCEYKGCDRPADMQARIHLPLRKTDPSLGCETRTVFLCSGCLDGLIKRTCAKLPFRCFCHQTMNLVSDVLLWTRSLR